MLPREVSALLVLLLLTFDLCSAKAPSADIVGHYLNEFAVEITGGPEVAQGVAEEHGFELIEQVPRATYKVCNKRERELWDTGVLWEFLEKRG